MWLLDANSVQLVFFANEEQTPPYAILSHTWSDDEISFQDIKSIPTGNDLATKAGWSKIEHACHLALSFGLRYVWVDTCCIDKSSSAELQEAINSMFRWYELAQICFAYLSDVSTCDDHNVNGSSFRRSRWFKRGWTLQELIAPNEVAFYDKDWKPIFTRGNTVDLIRAVTGIRECYLYHESQGGDICERLSTASVAERMSWMAERETTRPEDIAYCLLGIFDINMPMLYGEGPKAFQRLQEEIMKKIDDSSLLCWGYQEPYSNCRFQEDSFLAPHPSSFRWCGDFEPRPQMRCNTFSFSMTQRGLQMEVPVCIDDENELLVYMILDCSPRLEERRLGQMNGPIYFVAIPLISTRACNLFHKGWGREGEYLRPEWCRPTLVSERFQSQAKTTSIVIRLPSERLGKFERLPISIATSPDPITQGYTVLWTYPPQPIGSRLVLMQSKRTELDLFLSLDIQPKFPKYISTLHSNEHEVMIQINIPTLGTFVVVLECRVVAWGVNGRITIWKNLAFRPSVFKSPDTMDFEALRDWFISREYPDLPEVDCIFQDDCYIFNIGIVTDAYLVIQFTEDESQPESMNVRLSVMYPSGTFIDPESICGSDGSRFVIEDVEQELEDNDQFQTKVSPRRLSCVRKQLEKDFPKQ